MASLATRTWALTMAALAAGLVLMGQQAVLADPLFDQSSFSGGETLITFDGIAHGVPITTQFVADGVEFGGVVAGYTIEFDVVWPGSSVPVVTNSEGFGCPCNNDIVLEFTEPVMRVGFDALTHADDSIELRAYLAGDLVESLDFDTDRTPDFIGLENSGGFDTLVVHPHGPNLNGMLMDDLRFEAVGAVDSVEPADKADILIGSGAPGKGLTDAPGLQKEFNPGSKAAGRAGKK